MGVCPGCDAAIEIDEFDVDKGEVISCPECGVDLHVLNVAPLEFEVSGDDEVWSP